MEVTLELSLLGPRAGPLQRLAPISSPGQAKHSQVLESPLSQGGLPCSPLCIFVWYKTVAVTRCGSGLEVFTAIILQFSRQIFLLYILLVYTFIQLVFLPGPKPTFPSQ